ncbi:hypothetical protein EVJ58_g10544 [Rhodofomes roseus]|uniref:Phosphatidylinositol diacylglycerol-lyase n=1 Tax=Rhodofomes roseus TaxID=34475 RepID=A0A4Y9XNZ7_9APHY|nr:hypothetical protein EVJ58_g10544 [Rhodofomes roseus]
MPTDTFVVFTNDWPHDITVTTDENKRMGDTFPSPTVVHAHEMTHAYISASWWPGQSSFRIIFGERSIVSVLIGQGLYKTGVDSIVGPNTYEAGVVLAPRKPMSNGTCYKFFFFSGPSILPPLINSVIEANLEAVKNYIEKKHVTKAFGNFILTLSRLQLDELVCTYGTMTPAGDRRFRVNVILHFTGTVDGTFSWKTLKVQDFSFSTKKMVILFQATLDFSDLSKPSLVLDTLQVSMMEWSLSDRAKAGLSAILGDILVLPVKGIWDILTTAYRTAGFINTTFNERILNALNDTFKDVMVSSKFPAPFTVSSNLKPGPPVDYSTWMSGDAMQAKTLDQIMLPATHDSQAYTLSDDLSQKRYGDIAFLWNLDPGYAPLSVDVAPWASEKKYLGFTLYSYVIYRVRYVALAQPGELRQQLKDGIRHFDLRIYHDTRDGEFYSQHGLRGPKFAELLRSVKAFCDEHSHSHELIFLRLSHTDFPDSTHPTAVATMVSDILGGYAHVPPSAESSKPFDFDRFVGTRLGEIAAVGPRILVLNADGCMYPNPVLNAGGYKDQNTYYNTETPGAMDIVLNILQALTGDEQLLLKQISVPKNEQTAKLIVDHSSVNVFGMDWYNSFGSAGKCPIELIVEHNGVAKATVGRKYD